jgi:N-methylhydantoinase A
MHLIVGIDIGGTFTDTVVMDAAGDVETFKSPTTPGALVEGFLANVELAAAGSGQAPAEFLSRVTHIGHGTTAATNAYIERRGARVGLVTTLGFEDVVFHQRMLGMTAGLSRDELTDYSRRAAPDPLCPSERVHGVRERVDHAGRVLLPLREEDVRGTARRLREDGVEAVAVCFLWSFKNPAHERRAAEILSEELPDAYVCASCELVPRIGEYERTATTLVNAYLGPTVARYTDTLEERLAERGSAARVLLLDSSGGMMTPEEASVQPVRLLISGPSGGLTASHELAASLGHENVITFDMGGTSTDVGMIVGGTPLERRETVAEKYHLLLPMADITAIGAGGGSIARVEEGGYLRVGPESAGAQPGPACYRRGGVLPTVTDADLVLGIIDPSHFLGGRLGVDRTAAERAIEEHVARPLGLSVLEAAAGIKRIVDSHMADLLRTATIQRGYDPRDFVLYAFGGAGPTHAPAFGLELVDAILVPATQSVHSAFGAIASDLHFHFELSEPMRVPRDLGTEADEAAGRVSEIFSSLSERAVEALDRQRVEAADRSVAGFVEMRYARQTKELRIPFPLDGSGSIAALVDEFERAYARRYGLEAVPATVGFELVTFSLDARGRLPRPAARRLARDGSDPAAARRGERPVFDAAAGETVPTEIYEGRALAAGNRIDGPAVIEFAGTTIALTGGQSAHVDELANVVIRRAGS